MNLLEELVAQHLLNPRLLNEQGDAKFPLSNFEQVQRLSRMNLLDEEELLDLYSRHTEFPVFLKLQALFCPISLSSGRAKFSKQPGFCHL